MAKAKKNSKDLMMWVWGIVAAVVIIVVIIVVAISSNQKIDDSFFVSDGTKYVLPLEYGGDILGLETGEYIPEAGYAVYFYSGDNVTGLKIYYEYDSEETAKSATKYLNDEKPEDSAVNGIDANGKYVVISVDKMFYEGITAEEVKQQVDFIELDQNAGSVEEESAVEEDSSETEE